MDFRFVRNVILKGFLLFAIFNFLVSIIPDSIGKLSLYNLILEGRLRFPFGENPEQSYNLSLFNLDAMFASHIIDKSEADEGEFKVLLIGDSSTWGTLLRPEDTISGKLSASNPTSCEGLSVHYYNLGYPTVSLTKDLMIIDYALKYEPDLIIWLFTLESFTLDKQLVSPIVANNATRVDDLIRRYELRLNREDSALVHMNIWGRTLIGQRRALADLIRLQLYGVMWSATGIDQVYPDDYSHAQTDFDTDISFHGQIGPTLDERQLMFDILKTGVEAVGNIPILLVNEPILISTGENSSLRYNFLYPRWAYDQWRSSMKEQAYNEKWSYIDLWDLVPPEEFTNSAIHMTPSGVSSLVKRINPIIQMYICP